MGSIVTFNGVGDFYKFNRGIVFMQLSYLFLICIKEIFISGLQDIHDLTSYLCIHSHVISDFIVTPPCDCR